MSASHSCLPGTSHTHTQHTHTQSTHNTHIYTIVVCLGCKIALDAQYQGDLLLGLCSLNLATARNYAQAETCQDDTQDKTIHGTLRKYIDRDRLNAIVRDVAGLGINLSIWHLTTRDSDCPRSQPPPRLLPTCLTASLTNQIDRGEVEPGYAPCLWKNMLS